MMEFSSNFREPAQKSQDIRTDPTITRRPAPLVNISYDKGPLYEVEADSFDLKTYSGNYVGLILVNRLIFVADNCPKLRPKALCMALSHVIDNTLNATLYEVLYDRLQRHFGDKPLPENASCVSKFLKYNASWVSSVVIKGAVELEKLKADLIKYKSNSIKESTRQGYLDMGDHFVKCGDFVEATKSYSKMRDYCTNPLHIILMWFNTIKIEICMRNWSHVMIVIDKAESSLNFTDNSAYSLEYGSTLKKMTGLAKLGIGNYKEAADNFIQCNLNKWDSNDVVTPNDVAIYGGLCALATFDRSQLQNIIISNNGFKLFLDVESEIRDAILKFNEAKYELSLAILKKKKSTFLLDMFIGPHINKLYSVIRTKAMVQYFRPFDSADLRKMALCFNSTLPDLENELMQLILNGHIQARIDSVNKILYAKQPDRRAESFENAMSMAQQCTKNMHILILKCQISKHQNNVKPSIKGGRRNTNVGPQKYQQKRSYFSEYKDQK